MSADASDASSLDEMSVGVDVCRAGWMSVITQFDGPMITFGDGLRRHQERD